MNRNKAGIVCMIAGTVLIFSALFLILHNRQEDSRAGQAVESILPDLQTAISENSVDRKPSSSEYIAPFDAEEAESSYEMTVTKVDGNGYIGYLSIPTLGLELPVMSEWSYSSLKLAPCRQFGSAKSDDLVIAGHNYRKHFGKLSHLTTDNPILFTDMNGEISYYLVGSVSVISPNSTEEVKNSEWDLVLYTCTYGGQRRIMVGCKRVAEKTSFPS